MESVNQKSKTLLLAFIIVVILLITNSLLAQQGWYKLNSPSTSDLHAVCFKDASSGCVIGGNVIFKTVNGGQNWTQVQNFPFGEFDDFTFESLCYTNATTGWIAGDLIVNPPGQHFKIILKTTDAGSNWIYSYKNQSETGLKAICYKNPYVGFSVGGNKILRSGDLGATWEECAYPWTENEDFNFTSVCFINSLTGFVAGEVYTDPPGILNRVILKTVNAGNTWMEIMRTAGAGLNSVNFCSSASGWAVGGNILLGTVNGGQNWVSRSFWGYNQVYILEHIYFPDQMHGWISGGHIFTFGQEYSNLIIRTTDGGQTWTEQKFSTGKSTDCKLNAVYFINSLTGWAVGDGGVIMKTTDGGTTYVEPNNETVPESFALYQNYPNPFNPSTIIKFNIPALSFRNASVGNPVHLKVFDIAGREVAVLVNEKLQLGTYEVTFDGSNLPSGVYFYQLLTKDFSATKKLILLK